MITSENVPDFENLKRTSGVNPFFLHLKIDEWLIYPGVSLFNGASDPGIHSVKKP